MINMKTYFSRELFRSGAVSSCVGRWLGGSEEAGCCQLGKEPAQEDPAMALAGVGCSSGSAMVDPSSSQLNAECLQHSPGVPSCSLRFLTTASLGIQPSVTGESGNSVSQCPSQLQEKPIAVQKRAYLRHWNELVIASLV